MRSLTGASPLTPPRLLHALIWAYKRTAGALVTHMIAYRKAKVAEDLYGYLSGLSDAELTARGLHRRELARFIRQRLD